MAFTQISPSFINSSSSFTFANVTATARVTSGDFFYANGVNVTSDIQSGLTAANAAITTANTALKSYTDNQLGTKAPTASPTFTGTVTAPIVSVTGNLTTSGNILQQQAYYEQFGNVTNSGGNLVCNFNNGTVFYVPSLTANVTASFTNVNAISGTVSAATIIINQGATAYTVSNVQINGVNQTVKWVGATGIPAGTASNVDIMSFSLISFGGSYTVLGQQSNYG
jgi:hypothetical protein